MGIFSFLSKTQYPEDGGKAELLSELENLRDGLSPVTELLERRHSEHTGEDTPYAAPMAAANELGTLLTRLIKRVSLMLPPRDARRAAHLREGILSELRRAREAVGSCGTMFSPLTEEVLPLMRRVSDRFDELLSI